MDFIFDTHAHYDDEAFTSDRDEVLKKIRLAGVRKVVTIGADYESSENACAIAGEMNKKAEEMVDYADNYPGFYAAVGIHPEYPERGSEEALAGIRRLATKKLVVAIGEIGLDYHWTPETKEAQIILFKKQLEMAKEFKLPVVIHSREAAADTLEIMKEYTRELEAEGIDKRGVIHCYSYSAEMAKEYVKMGYYIGIGGVVTYKNARKTVETVEAVPLDRIVLETDCPYLTPVPHRGERNDSSMLTFVAEKIAEIKNISVDEVCKVTWENAHNLYNIEMN